MAPFESSAGATIGQANKRHSCLDKDRGRKESVKLVGHMMLEFQSAHAIANGLSAMDLELANVIKTVIHHF